MTPTRNTALVSGILLLLSSARATGAPAAPEPAEPGSRAAAADPGAGGTTGAPPSPEVSPEAKIKAKALFAKGARRYKAGKLAEAIALFQEAYNRWKNPRILLNIAICHLEMGQTAKAVQTLREGLRKMPPDKRTAFREKLPPKLVEADRQAGRIEIAMPEPGVVILLDDRPAGQAPLTVVVMPGSHRLVARRGDQEVASQTLSVTPGAHLTWRITAWPKTQPSPPPHKSAFLARLRGLGRLPIWYAGAAAVLTVVAGAALVGAGVKTRQLESDFPTNPSWDARDRGLAYRAATNTLIGVTVCAGVATGVLALFTDWRHPFGRRERQARVLPSFGAGSAGIAVTGRF